MAKTGTNLVLESCVDEDRGVLVMLLKVTGRMPKEVGTLSLNLAHDKQAFDDFVKVFTGALERDGGKLVFKRTKPEEEIA